MNIGGSTGKIGRNGTDDSPRFAFEGGEWKHRFSEEEIDLFGSGVPFEEWVEEKKGATPDGTEQYQNAPSPDELFPEDTNGDEGEGI